MESEHKRVLLFGGTFSPTHNGHLIIAQEAVEQLRLDEVIFIPSASPPHKEDVLNYTHRLKMAHFATRDIDYFRVSDIESKIEGPNYTINTVKHFREKLGEDTEILWLINDGDISQLKNWYKIKELLQECTFLIEQRYEIEDFWKYLENNIRGKGLTDKPSSDHFYVLCNERIDILSTNIRMRIRKELKYAVKFLVPQKVEEYIYDNRLYLNKQ